MHLRPTRPEPDTHRARPTGKDPRAATRGQVVVIFAGAVLLLMLMTALVVDVSWYWVNSLRVQRAADAAALAGAVMLPSDRPNADDRALQEAKKNGYAVTTNCPTVPTPTKVCAHTEDATPRRLSVDITAPVGTFFMRIIGITTIPVTRTGRAEYVLPVPMGSPQNYYGVGYLRDGVDTTRTTTNTQDFDRDTNDQEANLADPVGVPNNNTTGWLASGTSNPSNGNLTDRVEDDDSDYVYTTVNNRVQRWGNFGLTFPLGTGETLRSIDGIQVDLGDVRVSSRCSGNQNQTSNQTRVRVDLSWNGGANWSGSDQTDVLDTSQENFDLGDNNSLNPWSGHTWTQADFADGKFMVRFTAIKGSNCSSSIEIRVDQLRVTVNYTVRRTTTTTTTTTNIQQVPVVSPYGDVLPPQNFWGGMQSQGAPNIQGDAYMTKYESRNGFPANNVDGTDPDAVYNPDDYYSYAIEMPPNSTGGEVWIFDPGFCDASSASGTGENWAIGGDNGYSSPQPVSAFYTLQDAGADLYSTADDGTKYSVSSGNTFRRLSYTDRTVIDQLIDDGDLNNDYDNDRSSAADCGNVSWHYDVNQWNSASPSTPRRGWYLLGSGLTGGPTGTVYRLHAYSTDLANPNDQNNTTALNSFAIYAKDAGATQPKVYGLGAMEAYVRLPSNQASEFYLAQIDKVHAGKTMVINLWDPGDTAPLRADLQILAPNGSTYSPVSFDWTARRGTSDGNAANCNNLHDENTMSVRTNNGGGANGIFNGCWLTVTIKIPNTYSAPHPSSDHVTNQGGWWKIRYTMGSGSDFSTDLTTWQVSIIGNPVHLVVP